MVDVIGRLVPVTFLGLSEKWFLELDVKQTNRKAVCPIGKTTHDNFDACFVIILTPSISPMLKFNLIE